jgi:hypothetical protein
MQFAPIATSTQRSAGLSLLGMLGLGSIPLQSQEVSLLAGAVQAQSNSTYEWQLEFHQPLNPYVAASLSWINEGHFEYHRRDGATGQFWLQTPWAHTWQFGVAVGPYIYFDTEPKSVEKGYADHHGVGAAISAAAWWNVWRGLDLQLRANALLASGDINSQAVMFGVGYRLDHLLERTRPGDAAGSYGAAWLPARQEIAFLAGQSSLNALNIRKWLTYGLDYQYNLTSWLAASATGFVDSGSHSPHDRVGAQLRLLHQFEDSPLVLTAGVGAYATLIDSGTPSQEPVEGLLLLRAGWNLTRHLSAQASWYRSFTQDDHDLDIITAGLAWRFGTL